MSYKEYVIKLTMILIILGFLSGTSSTKAFADSSIISESNSLHCVWSLVGSNSQFFYKPIPSPDSLVVYYIHETDWGEYINFQLEARDVNVWVPMWQQTLFFGNSSYPVATFTVSNNNYVYAATNDGTNIKIFAFNGADKGNQLWKPKTFPAIDGSSVELSLGSKNNLYCYGDNDFHVYELKTSDGTLINSKNLPFPIADIIPGPDGKTYLIPKNYGELQIWALNENDLPNPTLLFKYPKIQTHDLVRGIIKGNNLYLLSANSYTDDYYIYIISLKDGHVVAEPRTDGTIMDVSNNCIFGFVWGPGGPCIAKYDLNGKKITEYSIATKYIDNTGQNYSACNLDGTIFYNAPNDGTILSEFSVS